MRIAKKYCFSSFILKIFYFLAFERNPRSKKEKDFYDGLL